MKRILLFIFILVLFASWKKDKPKQLSRNQVTLAYIEKFKKAAVESQKDLIDDIGIEGFSEYTIERNMDDDEFETYVRDFYESDIRDSPDSYFNSDDFVLTDEQEEKKEELENYINEQEDFKSELEEKQRNLEDSDSEEYELIQKQLDEIEENIEKAQDEFDSIEPDTEPTEEMIEEKLDELVKDAEKNPIRWCKNYDIDMAQFVSIQGLAEYVVDNDGLGVLSSYDGSYDTQTITKSNGETETFVIIRTQ